MNPLILTKIYDASLNKVWDAFSIEKELKKWFFDVQNFKFEVGNTFTFFEPGDKKEYFHQCEILTIEPQKTIEYTWTYPDRSKGISTVKWEMEAVGNQTKLTLTHSGIENFSDTTFKQSDFEKGWDGFVNTSLRNYLYEIKRLAFEIEIQAPKSKVWQTLWSKETYTNWTTIFCEGSYYEGELAQGNRVHFLSPSGEGMFSEITLVRENEKMMIKHLGMLKDKKELPIDAETEKWTGSYENYTLIENNNKTLLKAETDCIPEYEDYMKKTFPLALEELKRICEEK